MSASVEPALEPLSGILFGQRSFGQCQDHLNFIFGRENDADLVQAKKQTGLRVLSGCFQRIDQAIGILQGRDVGAAYVRAFIETMKRTGYIRKGLDAAGQFTAKVSSPAFAAE